MYEVDGAPMAYLVDEEGITASELVSRAQAVLELADGRGGHNGSRVGEQLKTRPLAPSSRSKFQEPVLTG